MFGRYAFPLSAFDGALAYAVKYFNGIGIFGWQDASVSVLPTDAAHIIDVYTSALQPCTPRRSRCSSTECWCRAPVH